MLRLKHGRRHIHSIPVMPALLILQGNAWNVLWKTSSVGSLDIVIDQVPSAQKEI